jgi:hypothetical protein
MRCESFAIIVACAACSPPVVSARSAIGIRVTSVAIEGVEAAPVVIRDEKKLYAFVRLLDRYRLSELGTESHDDRCAMAADVKIVLTTTGRDRVVCLVVEDVWRCAFFNAAHDLGLIASVPRVCVGFQLPSADEPCLAHDDAR